MYDGCEVFSAVTGGLRRAQPSRRPLSFSQRINEGNRSPELFGLESFDPELTTEGLMAERPVEGNAEPRFSEAGR